MIVHFMKRSDCKRKGLVGGRTSPQTPHQSRRRAPLISSLLKSPRECADFFSLRRLRLRFLLKVASPLRRWLRHLYAPRFAWSNASQGVGLGKLVFLFSPFSLFCVFSHFSHFSQPTLPNPSTISNTPFYTFCTHSHPFPSTHVHFDSPSKFLGNPWKPPFCAFHTLSQAARGCYKSLRATSLSKNRAVLLERLSSLALRQW